jgi:predicted 3-demethylubiquinone-9 3-methyltransferase (glyoxalase superfamily)
VSAPLPSTRVRPYRSLNLADIAGEKEVYRLVISVQKITPFLLFSGQAEEAMAFYLSLFDRSEVLDIQRYGPNEAGAEESVMHATFSLSGQQFACIDSYVQHAFTFTPAISLSVTCDSEDEIDRLFARLSEGGQVFMPLDAYPFSEKFAWIADRYGVSWQLTLAREQETISRAVS